MIKKKYEERVVTKTEKVLVEEKRYCDCCGAEITGEYFRVMTGHHEWGNDSIDSYEHLDYCSINCLLEKANEYYSNGDGKDYSTAFFEISTDS